MLHLLAALVALSLPWPAAAAPRPATTRPAASSSREDERRWFKLVTPNFHLYGNTKESDGITLLRDLETFRHVTSRFLGLTNVQREPALVVLFDSDRAFAPYKPRYQGRPRAVSGIHVADPLGNALALERQSRGDETMRVLFHEYTHLLTARQFHHVPVWAHEGVAEVFSTFENTGDTYDIGIAITNHVRFLQKDPPMPVSVLLGVNRDSPDYNEQKRAGKFYATSWLLAHHLLFARRGFETNVMARYAALCSATTNRLEAFQTSFNSSPALLDAQLAAYLKGGRYTIVRQTYPDLEEARPARAQLSPGELDFVLGRLLQLTQQNEAAQQRLEIASRRAPADPRPLVARALLAWRQHDRGGLRTLAEEAIRLGSANAFIHFLASEVRYQELAGSPLGPERTAALQAGRALCERALQLDPELAPAHHLLGVYVLALNPRVPGLAAIHVRQAIAADPQYLPAQITWASLLAAQGQFGAAQQALARLLASPLPPDLRENAEHIAKQIEKAAARSNNSPRRR